MASFSYTKSNVLVTDLEKVDELKKKLLLTPLAPREKLIFRWNAKMNNIYYSIAIAGRSSTQEEVASLFSPQGPKNLTRREQEIINYKKAHDYIFQEWSVNIAPITEDTLIDLYAMVFKDRLRIATDDLAANLKYIQANPDHPLVQAALAQITILSNEFFGPASGQMAHLTSLLFLYKSGYDFKGMISLAEYFYKNKDIYASRVTQSLRDPNVTPWLEFVVEAAYEQLTGLLTSIQSKEYLLSPDTATFNLTSRQKSILSLLDNPGAKISNRDVQRAFKISAITAARDLAKLTSVGLLFSIGKGRSTYYTKV